MYNAEYWWKTCSGFHRKENSEGCTNAQWYVPAGSWTAPRDLTADLEYCSECDYVRRLPQPVVHVTTTLGAHTSEWGGMISKLS